MDFVVTTCSQIHFCTQCEQHYDECVTCCSVPTEKRYFAQGKSDQQFVSAVTEEQPKIGDIIASRQPPWQQHFTAK